MLGSKILAPACLALLIGGCPKRQTTPRIVYVQAPAVSPQNANSGAHDGQETLTIQEPGIPPTEESVPVPLPLPPPQAPLDKKAKTPRAPTPPAGEKPAVENPQPAPSESILQLQPQGEDMQEAVIGKRLDEMGAELIDLERRTNLSDDQRRTINDANTFRNQSLEALRQHDLLRAKQLADKTGLLIKAVQGRP